MWDMPAETVAVDPRHEPVILATFERPGLGVCGPAGFGEWDGRKPPFARVKTIRS